MWRPTIHNRTFDWMGEGFAPLIDREHFMGRSAIGNKKWKLSAVNVVHTGQLFEMVIAVPGFKKSELEVIVDDDILIIKGFRETKNSLPGTKFILEEFDQESFERRFRLGQGIGHEKIVAEYNNGLLKITFQDVPIESELSYQSITIE